MLQARAQKKWRAAKRRRLTTTPLPHGSSVRSKPCAPSKSSPALEGRDNRHARPSSASRTSNDPPQISTKNETLTGLFLCAVELRLIPPGRFGGRDSVCS